MKTHLPPWKILVFIGAAIAVAITSSVWLMDQHNEHGHKDYLTKEEWYRHEIEERLFQQEMRQELKAINRKLSQQHPY